MEQGQAGTPISLSLSPSFRHGRLHGVSCGKAGAPCQGAERAPGPGDRATMAESPTRLGELGAAVSAIQTPAGVTGMPRALPRPSERKEHGCPLTLPPKPCMKTHVPAHADSELCGEGKSRKCQYSLVKLIQYKFTTGQVTSVAEPQCPRLWSGSHDPPTAGLSDVTHGAVAQCWLLSGPLDHLPREVRQHSR